MSATTDTQKDNTRLIESPQVTMDDVVKPISLRFPILAAIFAILTVLMAAISRGVSKFIFSEQASGPNAFGWAVSSQILAISMAIIAIAAAGAAWYFALNRRNVPGWLLGIGGAAFVIAFLGWTVSGKSQSMPVVLLLAGGLGYALPLVMGAMSGCICERSGVINIAIEGQLLFGAFFGALFASIIGNAWFGLIGAPIAGALVAVLLALFTVNLRTDHIIVGVVLNMLILGLTNFLYSTLFVANPGLNQPLGLPKLRIPLLADIPIIGPVLFNQTILMYAMYVVVAVVQIMLFNSKWGLRLRACGEHPKAADSVGIRVNRTRWANVILGGALAGLGGASFTLGSSLAFAQNMTAGTGFIALAAMILGKWNPIGALGAALLFGFCTQLQAIMQQVGSTVPGEFFLMLPYIVTILAVAGFVGAVRPPAAEGKAYP